MTIGWRTAAILAALAAAFQVCLFPPIAWSPLAWLALAPLFVALSTARRPVIAIAAATLFGTLAALGLVGVWLCPALREFFGAPPLATAGMLAAVALAGGGLPLALLGAALARGRALAPLPRVLYAAAAWTAVEWVRAHLPYGIPWALLGTALDPASAPAQVADLGGVYLVSFVVALPSAAVAEILRIAPAE